MKFLLDMGLAQSTARFLRDLGHDAIHLRDEGLQRLLDEDIIEMAQEEGRIIITHDLDFGRIIALSRRKLPSLITLRLSDMRPIFVNECLVYVLEHCAVDLANGAMISVTDQAVRVRRLPMT